MGFKLSSVRFRKLGNRGLSGCGGEVVANNTSRNRHDNALEQFKNLGSLRGYFLHPPHLHACRLPVKRK